MDPNFSGSALQCVSGYPLLRVTGDVHEGLEIIQTERGAVVPGTGLILEQRREGRCEERSVLAHVLPHRRLDVSTSQRRCLSFGRDVGRHDQCRWSSESFTVLRFSSRGRRSWWGYRSDRDCLWRKDC